MNFKMLICGVLAALLLLGAGSALASGDTPSGDSTRMVAQFSGMKGAGAAKDATGTAADEDIFADDEYADQGPLVADPLYGFNLVMFHFNDAMYHGVFKPIAKGYAWAVPEKPRQWVRNFFTNLLFPVRFVNDLLQGKFDAAYMETSKFIANTAFGALGLADVTSGMKRNWEPERPTADGFGQTLGKAGIGHGVYLVWPIIGPSSIRESVGWVADAYLDPITYGKFTFIEFAAIRTYKNLNDLSLQLTGNEYEAITEGAVDKYAAVRDAYIRFRAKKVEE
ncbi:VacJ family lipoprotein [Pseudodesulfovibrio cashew]|uniref:VacJ family lipoprotein n=1 Tax=Pseudodesulfovibrio cashew TaxID=2678688 RepID=A0A6I6JFZ6_9BACT|nr:VacJ family lipoprotein [Pseudodesulfovibrio cashew]QGY39948.1 VacJ family lipoprotein [Pseudodesulfovibrio cashew]